MGWESPVLVLKSDRDPDDGLVASGRNNGVGAAGPCAYEDVELASFACPKIDHNAGGRDPAGKVLGEASAVLSTYPAEQRAGHERDPSPPLIAELGHSMQVVAGADGVVIELDRHDEVGNVDRAFRNWYRDPRPVGRHTVVRHDPSLSPTCPKGAQQPRALLPRSPRSRTAFGDQASGRGPACHPVRLDPRERSKMDPAFRASRDL